MFALRWVERLGLVQLRKRGTAAMPPVRASQADEPQAAPAPAPSGRTGGSWHTDRPTTENDCSSSSTSAFFNQRVRAWSTIAAMLPTASMASAHALQ